MLSTIPAARSVKDVFPESLLPLAIKHWSGTKSDISNLVLYQDDHILVVYKPPGVLSQPDPGCQGDDMVSMLNHLVNRKNGIGVIHRIDRPCSGVMVYAKSYPAVKAMNSLFQSRGLEKLYLCVVNGQVEKEEALEHHFRREMVNGRAIISHRPRPTSVVAALSFRPLLSISYAPKVPTPAATSVPPRKPQTLLEVTLETGRRHQIRAQLSHHGLSICGDQKYKAPQGFSTKDVALHAYALGFPHPVTGEPMKFCIGPPRIWHTRFGQQVLEKSHEMVNKYKKSAK